MNLKILKDYHGLKKGQSIPIHIGKINTWVGSNGTGKSTATQLLYSALEKVQPKLKKKHYWNNTTVDNSIASLEDVVTFSTVNISSDKLRQAQHIDMDCLIGVGLGRIWASEGQNSIRDMLDVFKNCTDDSLTIFDETDGHLDYFNKVLFFNQLLPRIKGTVISISHDSTFLANQKVFDFGDFTEKMGSEYYTEMELKFTEHRAKMEKKHESKI